MLEKVRDAFVKIPEPSRDSRGLKILIQKGNNHITHPTPDTTEAVVKDPEGNVIYPITP